MLVGLFCFILFGEMEQEGKEETGMRDGIKTHAVPTPHKHCDHPVLQTWTNTNKNGTPVPLSGKSLDLVFKVPKV